MAVTNKANIVAVMGGSGSGKSTFIKREIARLKPKRLIVFDVMHEYEALGTPTKLLGEAAIMARNKTFKIIFLPNSSNINQQFDYICKLAFNLGDLMLVGEELNRVTEPNRAPPAWQDCTSRGRHKGLSIYGASQRPAGVDKDFFSNATRVRCGRLNFEADQKTMANVLNSTKEFIRDMKPLEFIERDMGSGKIITGKYTF